jgi:acyl dehydratase
LTSRTYNGRKYSAITIGETFSATYEVSGATIADGARFIRDFNPLHVDPEFAARSRFGRNILHGVVTAAIAGAATGEFFAGTAIAYLEQNNRFTAPVFAGDTLTTTWTVTDKIDKPKFHGGIVVLSGVSRKQDDSVVLEATGKILVSSD